MGSRPRGSCFGKVQFIKKKKKKGEKSNLDQIKELGFGPGEATTRSRQCSKLPLHVSMSELSHTLLCGQQRTWDEPREEPYLYYFLFTLGSLGAQFFGRFPQSKNPPSLCAAQPESH